MSEKNEFPRIYRPPAPDAADRTDEAYASYMAIQPTPPEVVAARVKEFRAKVGVAILGGMAQDLKHSVGSILGRPLTVRQGGDMLEIALQHFAANETDQSWKELMQRSKDDLDAHMEHTIIPGNILKSDQILDDMERSLAKKRSTPGGGFDRGA